MRNSAQEYALNYHQKTLNDLEKRLVKKLSKPDSPKCPNVVVDTNVLYSALFYRGNEHVLFEASASCLVKIHISKYISDEFKEVLAKNGIDEVLVEDFFLENKINVVEDDFYRKHKDYQKFVDEAKSISDIADRPIYVFARVFAQIFQNSCFISGDKDFWENKTVKKHLKNKIKTTKEVLDLI
ncbi:MAG: type II toxin-antitoxin system VapC family toxin [Candidatus Altiarchaeota archaeon]